jgi:hypothetical protein
LTLNPVELDLTLSLELVREKKCLTSVLEKVIRNLPETTYFMHVLNSS